ncbi:MAG TPA: DUF523 domain-containing protein, partial [Candidatus Nitrosotenuis sp.]|nr:DUF523 domain-containing protein [Candidatus Nitrosotenuis sp.]
LVAQGKAVLICPEEMGGLGTPRPAAALEGGGGAEVWQGQARVVVLEDGRDVTEAFRRGALLALRVAREAGACQAILKQHSPSCGCGSAGGVGGRLAADGVTAALFRQQGLELFTEEDL